MNDVLAHPMYDTVAVKELEFVFGSDGIVRVNVDGVCLVRVKMAPGCEVASRGAGLPAADVMDLLTRSITP